MLDSFATALPKDMPDLQAVSHLHGTEISTSSAVYRASPDELKKIRQFGTDFGSHSLRANRGRLRKWLMTGLEIRWGKKFTHYVQQSDGVTAFFSDGSCYRGDVLIGADGVHSKVRSQLFPPLQEFRPQLLPMGAIVGEVTATRDQYERWMHLGTSWFTGFAADLRVTILLSEISADMATAKFYWLFGWHDERAAKEDYWTETASQVELIAFVHANLEKLHPSFAEVFQVSKAEGIVLPTLRLTDMLPPPSFPDGRITLIGDSAKSMTPCKLTDALITWSEMLTTFQSEVKEAMKP